MDSQARDQGRCSLAAEALRSWGTLKVRAPESACFRLCGRAMFSPSSPSARSRLSRVRSCFTCASDRFFIHRIVRRDLRQRQSVARHSGRLHVRERSAGGQKRVAGKDHRGSARGLNVCPGAKAFTLSAGSWPGCFATGDSSGGSGCDSRLTAAKVRPDRRYIRWRSIVTERGAGDFKPCHGAARE